MLTIDNLSLFKDDKKIFSALGFSVSINSALIIRGRNGCGKTSLLKIIAGISDATSGRILWGGEDVKNFRADFNGDTQFIGHKNFLKPELTAFENLRFYSKLSDTEMALDSALNFFELQNFADEKIKKLSAGWQKRVMLAKLLACPATIWLLDEPSNNLDKDGKEKLYGLIKTRIKEDGLVIMTTHDEMFFDLGHRLNLEDFEQFLR
ncbi:MAG: heme ABC exporter, ATP-binding protein CcmA [Alphaproteobacteria bacterium RIFCSPLOWO2_01_FULL_40_26]|nr:MAG: heme ABC exporter, ATP-binding protein CcmA [Alphaproteobacteria bacterium RIFCSPHIGHO2_02_FULL_40_34]OFW86001.1 MAG: heme ABC exporter, ATP-binding protein CcmA [Alphaproteobacteria bacterium RIFCSPHIGHO2_01_FULL_40_8]OFW94656.1 MAG: heme ABC exporter, ATP-binding protein CcmA [Alphaproteobacteria bacterium RIFCSPLOWO2_01_FULL_40_26]OFX10124.1 MAG: heme ABC exporter, ATP-binding protein CcmA [Alphaproteobacteria bacterium RIFCSPLOWO2_02_FULL_40_19]OFX11753.1 MAG: heme ABC exporter, ATP